MKILKTTAFVALLFIGATAQAQNAIPLNEPDYNKPKIFADLPEKLAININELEAIFNHNEGVQITKGIASNFTISGTIISRADDNKVKSIVLKSNTLSGATFTFTRFKNGEGTYSYAGRMVSRNAADALVIEKEGANYILRKKSYYDLVNE